MSGVVAGAVGGAVGGAWHEVVRRFQHGKDKEPQGDAPQPSPAPTAQTPTAVDSTAAAVDESERDSDDPFALALAAAAARPGVSWLDIGERANGTLRCALELRARVAKNLEVRYLGIVGCGCGLVGVDVTHMITTIPHRTTTWTGPS